MIPNDESTIRFLSKSDTVSTYLTSDFDVFFFSLHAGMDRRVLIDAADINGRC